MRYFLTLLGISLLCACKSNDTQEKETSTTSTVVEKTSELQEDLSAKTDSACYLHTSGNKQQDTLTLKMYTKGKHVWGKLLYLYYEKDGRFGNFDGTKEGNEIHATWVFMQEGMKDSTEIAFRIQGSSLLQKVPGYDPKTGREVLNDTAAYSREYKLSDCGIFPKYKFSYFGL